VVSRASTSAECDREGLTAKAIDAALGRAALFDDLIRSQQQRRWNGEAEGFGGLQVDDELELGRLLDWQIGGLGALENSVHKLGGAAVEVPKVRAVGHEVTGFNGLPPMNIAGNRCFNARSATSCRFANIQADPYTNIACARPRHEKSRRCALWVSPRVFVEAEKLAHSIGLDVDTVLEGTVLALRDKDHPYLPPYSLVARRYSSEFDSSRATTGVRDRSFLA